MKNIYLNLFMFYFISLGKKYRLNDENSKKYLFFLILGHLVNIKKYGHVHIKKN